MMLSLLLGTNIVQVKLTNGQEAQGEFIGIYMDHIHILKDEKLPGPQLTIIEKLLSIFTLCLVIKFNIVDVNNSLFLTLFENS